MRSYSVQASTQQVRIRPHTSAYVRIRQHTALLQRAGLDAAGLGRLSRKMTYADGCWCMRFEEQHALLQASTQQV